jgi:hypothetical protein
MRCRSGVQDGRRAFPQLDLGRVAQWESACFTRKRSQVQNLPRPQGKPHVARVVDQLGCPAVAAGRGRGKPWACAIVHRRCSRGATIRSGPPGVPRVVKPACGTEQKQRKHDATTDHAPTNRPVRLETRVAAPLLGRPTCVRERPSAWLERQRESDRDGYKNDDHGCCPDEATIHDRGNLSLASFAAVGMPSSCFHARGRRVRACRAHP